MTDTYYMADEPPPKNRIAPCTLSPAPKQLLSPRKYLWSLGWEMSVMTNPTPIPPPGHPDAVAIGCCCPVLDNRYGLGSSYYDLDGNRQHWANFDCAVHVEQAPKDEMETL